MPRLHHTVNATHHHGGEQRWDRRWYHPLVAALWLAVAATIPAWSGISPWWMLLGLPVTAVAYASVDHVAPPSVHGRAHYEQTRGFVVLVGVAATAWLIYAGHTLLTLPGRVGGLLALWTAVTGIGYAWLYPTAPHRAAAAEQRATAAAAAAEERLAEEIRTQTIITQDAYQQLWNPWLAGVGLRTVTVEKAEETRAGYTLTLDVGLNPKGQAPKFADFRLAMPNLAVPVSRHYAKGDVAISVTQLRPEQTDMAHRWLLHVDTKQPLKQSIPHPGDRGPASITEPLNIGIYQDGAPLAIPLLGVHGTMVGSTGSGKSVLLNNVIAECTRRPDDRLWIAASTKLLPVVWPWLEPWLRGRTDRPVIDRIAGESVAEVLLLLADLYKIAVLRNRRLGAHSKHTPTPDDPAINAFIEEATSLAKDKTLKITTFDGREWTASALLDNLCSMARSASIGLFFLTQYGLIDALGDHGTNTMRNVTLRIAGRTSKAYDGQATLSGMDHVDTTKLYDHTLLVQPNQDVPRVIPAKAYELDGAEQIGPLAQAHTRYSGYGLPDWLERELGGSYTERWQPYRQLTLVAACELAGLTYPLADQQPPEETPAPPAPEQAEPAAAAQPGPDRHRDGGLSEPAGAPRLAVVTANPTTASTAADLASAQRRLQDVFAEYRDYPLGRTFTLVWQACRHPQAPPTAPAWRLALASRLVAADAPDEELDAAAADITAALARLDVHPVDVDGEPQFRREEILAAWEVAKAEVLAAEQASAAAADPVLAAVAGMGDDEWLRVSDLGVRAGRITEGNRAAAQQFGRDLRAERQLDETAFKQLAAGTFVRVGALRAAPRRAA